MFLELYQVEDTFNTINKRKTLVTSMNINFRKNTNILAPKLNLYYPNGLEMFNYAYIDELNRYYFVVNVEPQPNDVYIVQLEIDVLESYKMDILLSRKVKFKQNVEPILTILESYSGEIQDTSYILTTLAKTKEVI